VVPVTHAAAELGSGHAEHVAQHPWESGVAVDIDGVTRGIDFDLERDGWLQLSFRTVGG
jgi:hypothetical protein